jgi:hypothetical protein
MASILFSLCPVSYLDTRGFGLEMMKNDDFCMFDVSKQYAFE